MWPGQPGYRPPREAERLAKEAVDAAARTDYLVFQGRAAMGMAEVLELLGRE